MKAVKVYDTPSATGVITFYETVLIEFVRDANGNIADAVLFDCDGNKVSLAAEGVKFSSATA